MSEQVIRKPNSFAVLVLYLFAVVLLTACGNRSVRPEAAMSRGEATATPEPSRRGTGDVLRVLYWQAPTILNPHLSRAPKDWEASRLVYEPLASVDNGGTLVPLLAAEIPTRENGGLAPDGRSVTWKLKPSVKWSDGVPFTADDVLFTYKFITNPETAASTIGAYTGVASVEVIDNLTVKVVFKDVNPAWMVPFVGLQGMIIPRHIFGAYNGPDARKAPPNLAPVGTGPYRVAKFNQREEVLLLGTDLVQTNRIVFEPNPLFREADKPFFRLVDLKGGGTVNEAARMALQTGQLDYAWNTQLSSEVQQHTAEFGKGEVVVNFGPQVERIVLNRTDPVDQTRPHPFFSDKKVRQALAYAIDRDAIAQLFPQSQPTSNLLVVPPTYQSPNSGYGFDLQKAAALLDEAGWVDSDGDGIRDRDGVKLSVVFQTSVNPVRQQIQQLVQGSLKSIGVEVILKAVDASVFFGGNQAIPGSLGRFEADLEQYSRGNDSPDPGPYMRFWTCDQIPQQANRWSGQNIARWCNPAYDALYRQSTTELDPEKRRQLFIQMNDMLIDDVVVIPLVHLVTLASASNTIEGIDPTPWDADLWNIKDWRRSSR